MAGVDEYLRNCLFFTSLVVHRQVARLAERRFRPLGLGPMEAFVLMIVEERPGIGQKAVGEALDQLESSISRTVNSLAASGWLRRELSGKSARLSLTEEGRLLTVKIREAWEGLYADYSGRLGESAADSLTEDLFQASLKLEDGPTS